MLDVESFPFSQHAATVVNKSSSYYYYYDDVRVRSRTFPRNVVLILYNETVGADQVPPSKPCQKPQEEGTREGRAHGTQNPGTGRQDNGDVQHRTVGIIDRRSEVEKNGSLSGHSGFRGTKGSSDGESVEQRI